MSKVQKGPRAKADSPEAIVQVAVTSEAPRLVPLNEGRYVYYFDPLTRKTLHLPTHTAALAETLRPACEKGLAPRIRQELEGFMSTASTEQGVWNWSRVILDLQMAGILS